jgi:hypothetical protein
MERRTSMSPKVVGITLLGILLLISGSLLATSGPASAHERRTVQGFNFVVGFLAEPALVNQPNAVDLRVSRASDGSPVTGLDQTLKVEVTSGSQKVEINLAARFNVPGAYDGRFLPTRTGTYSFRFFGTIEGVQINETFTSSPTTFSSVAEPLAFPDKLVSTQDLGEAVQRLEERVVALSARSDDDSDTALMVGVAGVVLGTIGIGVGGFSLARRGR